MTRRLWPVVAAACILLVSGLAHGWQTDRWGASADLSVAAARLDNVPMRIGEWDAETVELPPEQLKEARVAGFLSRKYTHRYTRSEVLVLILCGRPGPVSVHSPDICYRGAGFIMGAIRDEQLHEADTAWVAEFKKDGPQPQKLRIRWAWGTNGSWTASSTPRISFARVPVLYKMYIVRPVPAGGDPIDQLPELEFTTAFLPVLQTALKPPQ